MKKRPEVIAITNLWIEKGDHDLINAKHTLTLREKCFKLKSAFIPLRQGYEAQVCE